MSDRPSDGGGSARSDAASRLAALLADVVHEPATPATDPERQDPDPGERAPDAPEGGSDADATGPIPGPPDPPRSREDRSGDGVDDRDDDVLAEARNGMRRSSEAGPSRPSASTLRRRATPPAPPAPAPSAKPATPKPVATKPATMKPANTKPAAATPALAKPASTKTAAPKPAAAKAAGPTPSSTVDRAAPAGVGRVAGSKPSAPPAPPPSAPFDDRADDDEADDDDTAAAPVADGTRLPHLTVRAVAFGLVLALLIGAVPVLGWVGKERLLDSRGGEVVEGGTDPSEPGFRALVNPTPTAFVVHRDAEGRPVSATVMSLGAGEAGGTVILMPMTLQLDEPLYANTIGEQYDLTEDDDSFRRGFEDVIGVSVPPPIIDLTDESIATLVAPVAPLQLSVNDPVVADDGTVFQGQVSLTAEQVGPYLRATQEGEPEIAQLERNVDVWAAWLAAIGAATTTEPIGAAATGVGSFLRVLAEGEPAVETLDVEEGAAPYGGNPFTIPAAGMNEQIIDAVPFPQSPRAGRRFGIKLLNGAVGESLPMDLMRDLIVAGGSLSTLGNADSFGREETVIEYSDEDWRDEAEALQALLGEGVEIEQMSARRAEAEAEDMVITVGSDVLARYEEQEDSGG